MKTTTAVSLLLFTAPLTAQVSAAADRLLVRGIERVLEDARVPGAVVVVERGDRAILRRAFGVADAKSEAVLTEDALFQIGSVTKVFTATLLEMLVHAGAIERDATVGSLLPDDVEVAEAVAAITLAQLVTHTSGLPRDPGNRKDLADSPGVMLPYSTAELYAALATVEPGEPGAWSYSNFGFGLLGHLLERASGRSYADLLRERILTPLGMEDTGIHPGNAHRERLATHHWPEDKVLVPRERWKFGEVVGFAGLYSSADDLLRFLRAQQPAAAAREGAPIAAAVLSALHEPSVDLPGGRKMSRGWFIDEFPGVGRLLGHGGEVDGHSACVAVLVEHDLRVVVLCNLGGDAAERVARATMAGLAGLLR